MNLKVQFYVVSPISVCYMLKNFQVVTPADQFQQQNNTVLNVRRQGMQKSR